MGAAIGVHGAAAGGGLSAGAAAPVLAGPIETVSFTIPLDAADQLERSDPLTQQSGLLPMISALELLLYPAPGVLTVWVSGKRRVMPVRIRELVFDEKSFDAALNPIRAEVFISLQVLKDAELANDPRGRALWDAHFAYSTFSPKKIVIKLYECVSFGERLVHRARPQPVGQEFVS